ncbi:MAG TPA: M28 family peptidase [Terriglobales bacterium]|jgi:Zn-dependent M28 family amino/carboxypeptidase
MVSRLFSSIALAFVFLLGGMVACSKQPSTAAENPGTSSSTTPPPAATTQPVSATSNSVNNNVPVPNIDGNKSMQYVKEVVAFGSRPPGSEAHQKLENYIVSKLKGVDVEQDKFTAQTPVGKFPINNIIAKFPGKKNGIIVVAGHYDTNYPLPKNYVGANDGGSSTALLLSLADQLRGKERDGYSVWLVWTDGEEAFVKWTDSDSLYGSKQLAQKWHADGTAGKIKAFILVDMTGDADLDIQRDANSTPWLTDLVQQAATNLGYQSHFFQQTVGMEDDHIPFAKAGIPVIDLIDYTYGYNNVFHHTAEDTVDKLSAQSMAITGDVVMETIELLDQR